MFKHYIKFAFRSLLRDKFFSLINILGLTIGLTGVFVVSIYLINELSFDQFHEKKDRIYRINTEGINSGSHQANSPSIISDLFLEEFPEVKDAVKVVSNYSRFYSGEKRFSEYIKFTSNNYFEIFDFPIISGNKTNPLKDKNDVIIAESMAIKLFDSLNIIGKTISVKIRGVDKQLKISALMKDIPWNSSIRGDIIGNLDLIVDTTKNNHQQIHKYHNYLLLRKGSAAKDLQNKINNYKNIQIPNNNLERHNLQSMNDFHLHSRHLANNWDKRGNLSQLKLFITIGLLLLLIATSNFIILSTAKSINRIREISLRKIIGASRKNIIKQISFESSIFCLIVIPLGIILSIFILPYASIIIGNNVEVYSSNITLYICSIFSVFIFLVVFSGTYIAFFASKFNPLNAFRGTSSKSNNFLGRKIMITLQLIIFITLVICVAIVQKQINYSKNMDLGFKKENLYLLKTHSLSFEKKKAFINETKSNPSILNSAYTHYGPPANSFTKRDISVDNDPTTKIYVEFLEVDFNFIETMKFELIEGRTFMSNGSDNPDNVCIISESVINNYDFQNPIGRLVGNKKVIGVIKDFHLHTTKYEVKPMVISLTERNLDFLYLRIDSKNISATNQFIENIWKDFFPNRKYFLIPFSTTQDRSYVDDSDFAKNLTIFSSLAIFLSIMGLFGLTLFTIEKRSKEIGIRKIHGASINSIMMMINKEFAILVGIATIISWPVAWYFMDKWLQNFAYTISFPFELYIFSGLVALFIVLLTVSIRSLKAALSNPVDAIRYE